VRKSAKGIAELRVKSYVVVVGPQVPMMGPIADGGVLIANTVHGCWGPMITPEMKGSHEVTQPVAVAGAKVGDAVALAIRRIRVVSKATASGTHALVEGRFRGDPSVAAVCAQCEAVNPPSYVRGIGPQAIRCRACDAEVIPFSVPHGYTMVFNDERSVGVTVDHAKAEEIAYRHFDYSGLWPGAQQHSVLLLALANLPGVMARVRSMVGNIGTTPAVNIPAANNAGDVAQRLVGAPHQLAISQEELGQRTDGHMDIDSVGEGAIVICPVKVDGAGIYIGDVHAMQGDGEIAGHTTDIAAEVVLKVSLIKGLEIDGPLLLPRLEDLPPLARPYSQMELEKGMELARALGVELETAVAPVQVVGTGADLMAAVGCGIDRMAALVGMSQDEIRNRVTITGSVEIGRLPGVVQVTALLPLERLDCTGLGNLCRRHYGL